MTFNELKAGAATVDITPRKSLFLHGYPFVERESTGTHDPLLSSALFLSNGKEQVLFISNDIIYVDKNMVSRVRGAISNKKGIPASNILIAATHTHSGPVTVDLVISRNDPVVPKADTGYLNYMEARIVEAACQAIDSAVPAEIAFITADATGVGTNRHDPAGPKDMELPVLIARNKNKEYIGAMLVCTMHPTIMHEDSTLFSGDFPFYIRQGLQEFLGGACTVVYFTGAAGNQSPRHVTKSNTFEEAERIGGIVARSIRSIFEKEASFGSNYSIQVARVFTDLPKREFPSVEAAEASRDRIKERFKTLKKEAPNAKETRTTEVNWFGAEELLFLAKQARENTLQDAYNSSLPAEIQVIKIGERAYIAWPGEVFVEYGLELKKRFNNISLITYANGELEGYVVTREAVEKGFYEAGNSLFHYSSGQVLVDKTTELLKKLGQ